MGALAGILLGLSQGMRTEHERAFQAEHEMRQNLLKFYWDYTTNPTATPEGKLDAMRRIGIMTQTPHDKKLPSDVTKIETLGKVPIQQDQRQVQPQQFPGMAAPPTPPTSGGGGDTGGMAAAGGASPGVLQGGANQLPPPPPMPPSGVMVPPMPPMQGQKPTYAGPPAAAAGAGAPGAFKSPQQMASEGALPLEAQMQVQARMAMLTIQQKEALLSQAKTPEEKRNLAMAMGVPTSMLMPHMYSPRTAGEDILNMEPGAVDVGGAPIQRGKFYRIMGDSFGGRTYEPTVGAVGQMPRQAWQGDGKGGIVSVLVDRTTNQVIPGSENPNIAPPPALVPRLRSSRTVVDAEGNTYTTSTTTPIMPGAGATAPPKPPTGVGTAQTPAKPAKAATGAPSAPDTSGGRLAYTTNVALTKDAIKASADSRKMVNLLDTAEGYVQAVNSGKQQADSAHDLGLIVQAVRAMNPGTVRLPQTEIMMEAQRGTYGQRFQRWVQGRLVDGTLPRQFRDELMGVIRDETTQVAKDAAANWQQNVKGKELPPHLKRFATTTGNPLDDEIMQAIQGAKKK